MKYLLTVTVTALLIVSTSASAWQDHDRRGNWNNNNTWDNRGGHDSSGDTSGDWDTNIQFDVQMRGSGDTEGYINGNLGEGWDNVQIHRYSNNTRRSSERWDYRPDYRGGRQPYESRRPFYGPDHRRYYQPGYGERYPGQQR